MIRIAHLVRAEHASLNQFNRRARKEVKFLAELVRQYRSVLVQAIPQGVHKDTFDYVKQAIGDVQKYARLPGPDTPALMQGEPNKDQKLSVILGWVNIVDPFTGKTIAALTTHDDGAVTVSYEPCSAYSFLSTPTGIRIANHHRAIYGLDTVLDELKRNQKKGDNRFIRTPSD